MTKNKKSLYTREEKKFIIGETTGLSIGLVFGIIYGAYFVSGLDGRVSANTLNVFNNSRARENLATIYKEHTRIVDSELTKIQSELGEVKGMLKVLINRRP